MEVTELAALQDKMWKLRGRIARGKELLKELNGELTKCKQAVMKVMEETETERYDCQYGSMTLQPKLSFTLPGTVEEKLAFWDWYKEEFGQEALNDKLSMHSGAFNSDMKEVYLAVPDGEEFKVPGVNEPKVYSDLGFNKKRGVELP